MIVVTLTPAQRDHAEWALGPMADIPDEIGWYTSGDLPFIERIRDAASRVAWMATHLPEVDGGDPTLQRGVRRGDEPRSSMTLK